MQDLADPGSTFVRMIIGIDPGLANTGWALVERSASRLIVRDSGTIRTTPRMDHVERLKTLFDEISHLIGAGGVTGAAIESWFVHPVSTAAMGVAEARGALLVARRPASTSWSTRPPRSRWPSPAADGPARTRSAR